MAEEKKEKWLNFLSGTTVVIAVFATLSTFKGSNYSNRSLLSQSKASDQWAYYQSKSIKLYLNQMQKENLEMEFKYHTDKKISNDINERIAYYDKRIKKYEEEKEQITKEAKELESLRDNSKKHSENFGIAVIFLQVGVLLSSIAALIKKKPIWYISICLGIIGILYFINGFLLLF